MNEKPPILALTMGDPAGIGPEIVVKALAVAQVRQWCRPVVIGWAEILRQAADQLHLGMKVRTISDVSEARFEPDCADVLEASPLKPEQFTIGKISPAAGVAALEAVKAAARLALDKKVDGLVTGPLNKEAIAQAGVPFTGHTETLAEVTHTQNFGMMLSAGKLRIVHVSTHVSLRQAIERVKKDRVLETIRLADEGCRLLGISDPHLAVAGLNPHAGEGGLFGNEEIQEITPAIEAARAEGLDVTGPLPPDTVFLRGSQGEFSAVIAMYHDQGHIPAKLIAFKTGVNITLGLPIVRTSVDHGTAFDIAGKGIADPADMVEAIRIGAQMARAHQKAA
ncbi:MAG TPA: 4-hydroxythreonine-4-phosphate dehydrogenase PdxA [Armatimonadota bacterium]|nr:4-hydroxythreonine-4-phosphate dehydrogenase PdxA [Armatimonadota bacterium]